jgi:hypothetical protein
VAHVDPYPVQAMTAPSDSLTLLPSALHDLLGTECRNQGIPTDGATTLLGQGSLIWWAHAAKELGGMWRILPGATEWTYANWHVGSDRFGWLEDGFEEFLLSKELGFTVLEHVSGLLEIEVDGIRFLIAGYRLPSTVQQMPEPRNMCVLAGQDAGAQRAFLRRVLNRPRVGNRVTFWHGARGQIRVPPVAEEEVILRPEFKQSLLGWLDHFWRQQAAAEELGVPLRRGLLLLGAPGTGKTQLIRHVLSRFPDREGHLYVATAAGRQADTFSRMMDEVGMPGRPKIVILEDIDLLQESGGVPQAHLLNALDGLLRVETPVLWIATSNDPSALALNLLDRPGRFDRVVVLPEPRQEERETMVRLFSRNQASGETIRVAAEAADGFTGAHIREACTSAILAQLSGGGDYGTLLLGEIYRMAQQHTEAQSYFREVSSRRVGFAPSKSANGHESS